MIDIIFLALLILGAYAGYQRGFLLEIIGIFALFLGLYGAFVLLKSGVNFAVRIFPEYSNVIPFLMFLVIFILIIILVNLLGRMLKKIIDTTILGAFDKLAGAILGFFVWAFMISLVLWILGQAGINLPERLTDSSYIYPLISGIAPTVGGYVGSLLPFAGSLVNEIKELFAR
ncbi:MAG TPA: CvpA family protein [Cyclobacteriaceae bacterium]|nr:CvpA family protein [Cyclobacteriaceae bacterium]